ncbi:MAG: hypothetical protein ACKOSS_11325 [Planctomycetia bacterium]
MLRAPLVAVLLLAALAGGVAAGWGWRGGAASAPPPAPPAAQRLEARLELLGHGAWYGFTVDRAATLRMQVDLPPGVRSTLVWGRLGTALPGEPGHLPAVPTAERVPLEGPMAAPLVRRATGLGPTVLFVEQPALVMGEMHLAAHVRIEIEPDPVACRDGEAPAGAR